MSEQLRDYLEGIFKDAPKSRKAMELKEELMANSQELYEDLVGSGMNAEDAYAAVVGSIGDIPALFTDLETDEAVKQEQRIQDRQKRAMLNTVAVGLYIFSVVVFFIIGALNGVVSIPFNTGLLGVIVMLLIDIVPTCMLVYSASLNTVYVKKEDTLVEDFRQWQSGTYRNRSIKTAASLVLWTGTVVLYFVLSYATWAWYATWIVFPAALCGQMIILLVFRLKENKL